MTGLLKSARKVLARSDRVMLSSKTVVITGASSGLGAELARQLAPMRSNLVLCARDVGKLELVAQQCRGFGASVVVVKGDVTCSGDCKRFIGQAVASFGGIDILINNAGISMCAPFSDVKDVSIFEKLMQVNYLGNVYCVHAALPFLKERKGLVVCLSSLQAKLVIPGQSGYAASKHALQGFYDALRMELSGQVDVMMVLPSWIQGTGMRCMALNTDGGLVGENAKPHKRNALSVVCCAKKIIRAMCQRKRDVVLPGHYRFIVVLRALFGSWIDGMIKRKFKSLFRG